MANDATPNVLFDNNRDGTFSEIGLKAGLAYNEYGEEEAGMGVSGGDYDGDGDLDLYITHFFRESNTFYHNDGQGHFKDITTQIGLEEPHAWNAGGGAPNFSTMTGTAIWIYSSLTAMSIRRRLALLRALPTPSAIS